MNGVSVEGTTTFRKELWVHLLPLPLIESKYLRNLGFWGNCIAKETMNLMDTPPPLPNLEQCENWNNPSSPTSTTGTETSEALRTFLLKEHACQRSGLTWPRKIKMRVFEKTEKRASEFSQRSSFQMQNRGQPRKLPCFQGLALWVPRGISEFLQGGDGLRFAVLQLLGYFLQATLLFWCLCNRCFLFWLHNCQTKKVRTSGNYCFVVFGLHMGRTIKWFGDQMRRLGQRNARYFP